MTMGDGMGEKERIGMLLLGAGRYRVFQALKHIARSFDPEKIKASRFEFLLKQDSQRIVVDGCFEAEGDPRPKTCNPWPAALPHMGIPELSGKGRGWL